MRCTRDGVESKYESVGMRLLLWFDDGGDMVMDNLLGGGLEGLVIFSDNSIPMAGVAKRFKSICAIVSPLRISNFFLLLLTSSNFTYPW